MINENVIENYVDNLKITDALILAKDIISSIIDRCEYNKETNKDIKNYNTLNTIYLQLNEMIEN